MATDIRFMDLHVQILWRIQYFIYLKIQNCSTTEELLLEKTTT